ncbi:hypothetical protein [Plantactinospora veratri]
MTSPDQPGEQPYRPGGGSGEPPPAGERPAEPVAQPWDWAIDPPPPEGPTREPTPDPAAGATIDEVPDPLPLTGRYPDTIAPGTGPPSPPRPEGGAPPPPDWSTPETRVSTPPLSGYPRRRRRSRRSGHPNRPRRKPEPGRSRADRRPAAPHGLPSSSARPTVGGGSYSASSPQCSPAVAWPPR